MPSASDGLPEAVSAWGLVRGASAACPGWRPDYLYRQSTGRLSGEPQNAGCEGPVVYQHPAILIDATPCCAVHFRRAISLLGALPDGDH